MERYSIAHDLLETVLREAVLEPVIANVCLADRLVDSEVYLLVAATHQVPSTMTKARRQRIDPDGRRDFT